MNHGDMPSGSPKAFKPYIPADQSPAEFTPRAVLLGIFFGLFFGAVTVYLALKVGLTVSASIPIAVLSIVIFKAMGGSSILENNIVQTTGSAGESIAAGVVFTLPALVFHGFEPRSTVLHCWAATRRTAISTVRTCISTTFSTSSTVSRRTKVRSITTRSLPLSVRKHSNAVARLSTITALARPARRG